MATLIGTSKVKYDCLRCKSPFDTIELLKHHWIQVHHLYHPRHCKICNIPFPDEKTSEAHKIRVHGTLCAQCGRAFVKAKMLEKHMVKAHNTRLEYPCKICGFIEFEKTLFIRHLEAHQTPETGTLVFRCFKCNHAFLAADELRAHENIHDPKMKNINNRRLVVRAKNSRRR